MQDGAAAAASPQTQPQHAVAPTFRPFDAALESWTEWSREFGFHLAAYRIQATVPSGQRPGDPSTGSPQPQVLPTLPSILPHGDAPPPPPVLPLATPAVDASLQPPGASLGHAPPIASRDQLYSDRELLPAPDRLRPSGAPARWRSTLRPLLSLYGRIHRMLARTLEQVFRRFLAPRGPNGRVRVAQPRLLGYPPRRIRQHGVLPTAGGSLMP
ncbi:uncharacterized protein LOC126298443 [Schistocerca gregaria]|uniref:uncharacterized protein LOC126298443 n=1 Tax=Schistocerca gregaria TaxID=7010 RepID=UPI00211F40C7|nr:uncharacterized protein LOC126298443 [Schistocerca gregaria]